MKLIITDLADPNFGLKQTTWEIDVPYLNYKEELGSDEDFKKELEFFRQNILSVYREYAQGKLLVRYDFEIEKMEMDMQHEN